MDDEDQENGSKTANPDSDQEEEEIIIGILRC
jgi:hypothetical protein